MNSELVLLSSPIHNREIKLKRTKPVEVLIKKLVKGVPDRIYPDLLSDKTGLSRQRIKEVINDLIEKTVVVRRKKDQDILALTGKDLYDRQIRFFSYFETGNKDGVMFNDCLQDRKVVIPGLGGLGGWLALLCARLGIRNIVGIDHDKVELSNLHRQILFTAEDIGKYKAEAAKQKILEVDNKISYRGLNIDIEDPKFDDVLLDEIKDADLVINGFPHFVESFKGVAEKIGKLAYESNVPCVNSLISQCVGPFTIDNKGPCFNCAKIQLESELKPRNHESPLWQKNEFLATIAPRQSLTASILIWEVAKYLSGIKTPSTENCVVVLDTDKYINHKFYELNKMTNCPVCGNQP